MESWATRPERRRGIGLISRSSFGFKSAIKNLVFEVDCKSMVEN